MPILRPNYGPCAPERLPPKPLDLARAHTLGPASTVPYPRSQLQRMGITDATCTVKMLQILWAFRRYLFWFYHVAEYTFKSPISKLGHCLLFCHAVISPGRPGSVLESTVRVILIGVLAIMKYEGFLKRIEPSNLRASHRKTFLGCSSVWGTLPSKVYWRTGL